LFKKYQVGKEEIIKNSEAKSARREVENFGAVIRLLLLKTSDALSISLLTQPNCNADISFHGVVQNISRNLGG